MINKKSSFAPATTSAVREHSVEETKQSQIKNADTSANNIMMMTNLSIDNGSSSLGSGRGFKPNNFNGMQSAGIKKSLGSNNNTGSQTRINVMQSPRSPDMMKRISRNGKQ